MTQPNCYFDRSTNTWQIEDSVLKLLKNAYGDVESELNRMAVWMVGPKGKHRKGNLKFVRNWLDKRGYSKIDEGNEADDNTKEFLERLKRGSEFS